MEEEEEDGDDDWNSDAESVASADINLPPNPRRYFNQRLRPVYEQVPIPPRPGSEPGVAASIGMPRGSYTRTLPRKGQNKWRHSVRTPPVPPSDPLYGGRFKALLGLIEEEDEDDEDGEEDGDDSDDDDTPPAKRCKNAKGKAASAGNSSKADAKRGRQRKQPPAKAKTSTPKPHDEILGVVYRWQLLGCATDDPLYGIFYFGQTVRHGFTSPQKLAEARWNAERSRAYAVVSN